MLSQDKISTRLDASERDPRMTMADARQEAISIVVKAYQSISTDMTAMAFKAAGIGLNPDGSEDSMWRAFRDGEILGRFVRWCDRLCRI